VICVLLKTTHIMSSGRYQQYQIIDLAASKAVGAKTSVVQVSFSVLVLLHTLQFIIILVWPVMTMG